MPGPFISTIQYPPTKNNALGNIPIPVKTLDPSMGESPEDYYSSASHLLLSMPRQIKHTTLTLIEIRYFIFLIFAFPNSASLR